MGGYSVDILGLYKATTENSSTFDWTGMLEVAGLPSKRQFKMYIAVKKTIFIISFHKRI